MTRKPSSASRAARRAMEIHALAPAVAARRLLQLPTMAPWQAALQWNRWALEKSAAFSLAGMALAQASWQAVLASGAGLTSGALRAAPAAARDSADQLARAAHAVLAPVHRRVRRNARRTRG